MWIGWGFPSPQVQYVDSFLEVILTYRYLQLCCFAVIQIKNCFILCDMYGIFKDDRAMIEMIILRAKYDFSIYIFKNVKLFFKKIYCFYI